MSSPVFPSITKLPNVRHLQPQCNAVARKLDMRPRKRPGFKTPLECYSEF
jgi:IS30 family transposase